MARELMGHSAPDRSIPSRSAKSVSWPARPRLFDYLLFFLLFSGPPRFRERDIYASVRGDVDLVVGIHVMVWVLGAAWVFSKLAACLVRRRTFPRIRFTQKVALIFAGSLILSIAVSPAKGLTAFRAGQVLVMVLFGIFWISDYGVERALRCLLVSFVMIGLAIAVAALIAPGLVIPAGTRVRGDYIANTGAVGSIGLILLLGLWPKRKRFLAAGSVVMLAVLLAVSRTRAAYASLGIFLILALLPWFRHNARVSRATAGLTVVGFMLFAGTLIPWVIRETGSIRTLSGRTYVWQFLLESVLADSPLLGYGFMAERLVLTPVGFQLSSHSAYLAVLAGGGFIALFPFAVLLFAMGSSLIKLAKRRNVLAFPLWGTLLATLIIGVVSEESVTASPTGFTFYMLVSMLPASLASSLVPKRARTRAGRPIQVVG